MVVGLLLFITCCVLTGVIAEETRCLKELVVPEKKK